MDEDIFQLSQLFPNPAGTRIWQHYDVGERKSDECFASGVGSVVLSVNNGGTGHAHHWPKGLLRKQWEKSKLNLRFYVFFIHFLKQLFRASASLKEQNMGNAKLERGKSSTGSESNP